VWEFNSIFFNLYFIVMNIFIAGLSFRLNDDDLKNLFESYGTVSSARVIIDRQTSRSKGYGFVEMEDDEEARKAIAELNGSEFDERTISVSEARPKEKRSGFMNDNRGEYNRNR
jgi:RNA recognition motif-containing protein